MKIMYIIIIQLKMNIKKCMKNMFKNMEKIKIEILLQIIKFRMKNHKNQILITNILINIIIMNNFYLNKIKWILNNLDINKIFSMIINMKNKCKLNKYQIKY